MKKFLLKIALVAFNILIANGFINQADCAVITGGLTLDCTYPALGGAKDDIYLINLAEIASVTRNGSNPQIIEAITLVTGKVAFKYEGKNNSAEPQSSLAKQRYAEVYDHEVMFKVFTNRPTDKVQLELLAQGTVVAIVENNHLNATGNTSFEIYGLGVGLEVVEMTRILSDVDTQGAYNLILRTSEQLKESHLPNTLFITSYAATKAVVTALLT